jgi:hypothetical protein
LEITRTALLTVDPVYLRAHIVPGDAESLTPAERASAVARLSPELKVSLFPDVALTLQRHPMGRSSMSSDSFNWFGASSTPNYCEAFLFAPNGIINGDITCYDAGKRYYITHTRDHLYTVYETVIPPDGPDYYIENEEFDVNTLPPGRGPARDSFAAEPAIVRILPVFVYRGQPEVATPPAWNPSGVLSNDFVVMDQQIARANTILERSGVNVEFEWTGWTRAYDGGNHMTLRQVYEKVLEGSSPFENVVAAREIFAADLVSVWYTPTDRVCGWADTPAEPTSAEFVSVVAVGSQGCTDTFLHELGHNFGARHDRYVNGATNRNRYNFGYVSMSARKYTVMAYNKQCKESVPPVTCNRIPWMSTPERTPNGWVIGIARPNAQAAWDSRWMNERASIVAGFRSDP